MGSAVRFAILLLALLTACAWANKKAQWPHRGPFITVINDVSEPLSIVAHSDYRGGIILSDRVWPMARFTFRWPWIDEEGMLIASPYNTFVFHPWEADEWCWRVSRPTIDRGPCQ